MLGNLFGRIAAYPVWMQTLLYLALMLAALVVFGLLVLLSPFVMMLAGLVLIAAIFALVVRFRRRRPLRRWGPIAVMSLVVLLVFTGISHALYFNEQARQANSPERENQTSKLHPDPESLEQGEERKAAERLDQKQQEPVQANANTKAQPSAVERGASVTVKRAVDGETIKISSSVDGKDTVRLIGIDAPEKEKPGCGAQPLAQEAAAKLANWEGSKVRLEFDEDRTDEHGWLLAYVHGDALGDITLNEDMLRSGYAQLWILAPHTKYEDKLRVAQQEAKEDPIFGTSIWTLSPSRQDQLADHGNGIGEGDGACPLRQKNTTSSSASSSASPNLSRNNSGPDYNSGSRNAAGYSTSSPTAAPGGSSAPVSPAPATTGPPTSYPASSPTASPSASPPASTSASASP
jgi:endonuclease YncB( thermonuclease family)